jgi:hypothetical protein
MIELSTVSSRTDVSDYWDEELYHIAEYVDDVMDKERESYIANIDSVEELINKACADRFIIDCITDKDMPTMYDHPDVDIKIIVYDGYNE